MVQAGSGLFVLILLRAIPHNSKCRYGERGAADAKPKAQIILDAAKVSAASGGNSEPKQGQRSQSARGFCPRSTMRVPQPDIIEHFGNADAVPQPPERCLSRQAGIVRCVAKMLDNVGLRYPHRASGAKAPRTLRPLPLLRFAVSATGGAHLCSIQYYLRFWLSICRTSLAVSALRIMRYCLYSDFAVYDMKYLTSRLRRIFCLFGSTGSIIKAP